MAGPKTRVETAETEAAAWHTRLGAREVSTDTVEAFFRWRQSPANAEAYRRVEAVWSGSGALAGDPQMRAALNAAMSRRRPAAWWRRSGTAPGLAAVAATGVLAAMGAGWLFTQDRDVHATGVGELREVRLADGSRVRLDTDTRLRVRMTREGRRIELERGQALFEVEPDATRPFVVAAGDASVTAIGTVFDVRREAGGMRVTLVSGVVDVRGPGRAAPARMAAGQQGRVRSGEVAVSAADVATATSWTQGRIVLRNTPLSTAVAEVNRYLDAPITLDAGVRADQPVNGVFRTGDRDAFVSAASAGLGLGVVARADGAVLLTPRKNN